MKVILLLLAFLNYAISASSNSYNTYYNGVSTGSTFGIVYYIIILGLYVANITATIIMICKNYIPPIYHCLAIVLLFALPLFSSIVLWCLRRHYVNSNPVVISQGIIVQEVKHVPIVVSI